MSGIYGVVGKEDCRKDLFYGTDYHSHLGTQFSGIAIYDKEIFRKIHDISSSQFKSKFLDEYKHVKGNKGIGVISAHDEQPVYINSKFGPFAIITNGYIENAQELVKQLFKEGVSFSEITDGNINHTELIAKLIIKGEDIIDGIEKMFSVISGSCSLLILNKEGIYAARDKYGCSPLVIGQKEKFLAVTTETSAFANLDFKVKKFLEPGEIVFLNEEGCQIKKKGGSKNRICSFLWIYTGFPAASYENINAEIVRERCGIMLAKNDKVKADCVCGIPDSGVAHAIGYSIGSKLPYRRALVKYTPGYGRSYTPPSQETRDLVAKMKLIPVAEIIKGQKIIFCDDSIVRGTQLKNYTVSKLWENGAKEIHFRIACPPLMFPCKYNYSTRTINELAARKAIKHIEGKDIDDVSGYVDDSSPKYKKMVEVIRKDLDVTSLVYQKLDDMIEAIGLEKNNLCTYCWTGK